MDDKRLIQQVACGDREAFEDLYSRTYGMVARYVTGFVGDESLAEDVIVQTYTVVWQKAKGYRGDGRLTTWIIGIARNIAFKEFRKKGTTAAFDEAHIAPDVDSYRKPEKNDIQKKMKRAITALSPKHREVLELVFFQGLNYTEVSEIAGTPVNTVKTRVFHAKKALKDELSKRKITRHDIY